MAYLADVQLPAASKNAAGGSSTPATEYGLTMRGHLAQIPMPQKKEAKAE